ncbi:hypothetical protein HKX48_008761 [Thoreauomyces humboldtii]|nr:hypothetical protein HKX48_008761 [Thoreauomyces humboldtii]
MGSLGRNGGMIFGRDDLRNGYAMPPPTRGHWRPDNEVGECQGCQAKFGFLLRRHHHVLRLDHTANFHPAGTLARSCDACVEEYQQTRIRPVVLPGLGSTGAPSSNQPPAAIVEEPQEGKADDPTADAKAAVTGATQAVPIAGGKDKNAAEPPMSLMSVPSDWQWSTF